MSGLFSNPCLCLTLQKTVCWWLKGKVFLYVHSDRRVWLYWRILLQIQNMIHSEFFQLPHMGHQIWTCLYSTTYTSRVHIALLKHLPFTDLKLVFFRLSLSFSLSIYIFSLLILALNNKPLERAEFKFQIGSFIRQTNSNHSQFSSVSTFSLQVHFLAPHHTHIFNIIKNKLLRLQKSALYP